jgi:hypothetical protein
MLLSTLTEQLLHARSELDDEAAVGSGRRYPRLIFSDGNLIEIWADLEAIAAGRDAIQLSMASKADN